MKKSRTLNLTSFSFKATSLVVSALEKLINAKFDAEGEENLVHNPTLYVANHFTRFETFILPHIIHKTKGEQVNSLADSSLFVGAFGDYLSNLGATSTKDPDRDQKIISDLMTGRKNWLIYPEGMMIKNKKIIEDGKLQLHLPEDHSRPRTGSAVLALKSEILKRDYLKALKTGDAKSIEFLEQKYMFSGEAELSRMETVITPVNITYYPLRPVQNLLTKLAGILIKNPPDRFMEELKVEGQLLLGDADITVYFGKAIPLSQYVRNPRKIIQVTFPFLSQRKKNNILLNLKKWKLTRHFMLDIYRNVSINFDHLFAMALFKVNIHTVVLEDFLMGIYLAANEILKIQHRRIHSTLTDNLLSVICNESYEPLDSIIELAVKEEIITIDNGVMEIKKQKFLDKFDFHNVRLENMIKVIKNEIEPLKYCTKHIKEKINLSPAESKKQIVKLLCERDLKEFHDAYALYAKEGMSQEASVGRPDYLEGKSGLGIVLSHGFLSAPKEIRLLAEHLNAMGHSVYLVRLKGHGTHPSRLAEVDWKDWLYSYNRAYAIVKNTCEKVVLGGFSTGGLLALLAAARKTHGVDAVFCINAALKLNFITSNLVSIVTKWNDLLGTFNIEKGKLISVDNPTESPDVNYKRIYVKGIQELALLIDETRDSLSKVTVPTLIIQGDHDPVVEPKSAKLAYEGIRSVDKEIHTLPFDRHVIVRGKDSELVFDKVAEFINKRFPGL